ncbi:MAG: TATA-box-binding protein [Candidatus Methanofastidiosa archaeon]|nr:TATA-box-binding protein [Candidatus Methanofastidiosa archaeon]
MTDKEEFHIESKIVNVVVSADIHADLDLNTITARIENTEFEPEQFPGLVYKLEEPKTSTLVFSTGKLICTGAKSVKDAEKAIHIIINNLRDIGFEINQKPDLKLQNMVATAALDVELDLENLVFELENCEYEPEQFPGLVYRVKSPKVAILIFNTGRIVCAGAKSKDDVDNGIRKLVEELESIGIDIINR